MTPRPRQAVRVLLVDDHPAVRQGLALMLAEEGVGCCEAGGCEEALNLARRESPDVAVVDLSLAEESAFPLIAELHAHGIPVVVCSAHEDSDHVRRALAAGARAYVAKRDVAQGVARSVRDVLDGWLLVSPRAAEDLSEGTDVLPPERAHAVITQPGD